MGRPPEIEVRPGHRGGDRDRSAAAARRRRGAEGGAHTGRHTRAARGPEARQHPAREWCAPTRTPPPATSSRHPAAHFARRTSGCWPQRASWSCPCHARPRVAIVSTGDELVPARRAEPSLRPGPRCHRACPRGAHPRSRWRTPSRGHRAGRPARPSRRACAGGSIPTLNTLRKGSDPLTLSSFRPGRLSGARRDGGGHRVARGARHLVSRAGVPPWQAHAAR